jgi:DNA polymerase
MIVAGDFETHYTVEYSLKKMTTAEYILDHRFQFIMLSLKIDNGPSEILIGEAAIRSRLAQLDWSQVAWLSHHVNFDAAILYWRLGFTPSLFLCSLSMARAITHWMIGKSSLAAVSKYLNLPPKGDEVVRAQGKRLEDFSSSELNAYADYCIRDNENARAIFDILIPYFSAAELRLIDLIARMFIEPQVKLNANVLAEHLADVRVRKQAVFDQVSTIDPSIFSSAQRFAALLEEHGVEVPMKRSPATGEWIPALAKNDREWKELREDAELPIEVQALLAARERAKSTIEETRTARLLKLSQTPWQDGSTGWMPAPLKYYAARTGRLGGDDKFNMQNLVRGSRTREGIEAPTPQHRIIHRDSSQIEARMTAWLAGCMVLLQAFAEGRDVYSEFASSIYNTLVTKADTLRRFVGKTSILGLGYGCGPPRFRHMLYVGNGGISIRIELEEAERIVWHYRGMYPQIPSLWKAGDYIINEVITTAGRRTSNRHFRVEPGAHVPARIGADVVWLPNNMALSYPGLHWETDPDTLEQEVSDNNAYGGEVKLYGAKFIENLSQALSRIIITDIAVRVHHDTGYHPFLTTHDSLDYCVPVSEIEWWDQRLEYEFSVVPSWATGLPLASEGGWGRNLLAAERKVND